jgi:hypothetical protein
MTEAPQGTHSLAFEHVLKGRRIVARQRQLIDQIRARGGESAQAEGLLVQFERTPGNFRGRSGGDRGANAAFCGLIDLGLKARMARDPLHLDFAYHGRSLLLMHQPLAAERGGVAVKGSSGRLFGVAIDEQMPNAEAKGTVQEPSLHAYLSGNSLRTSTS